MRRVWSSTETLAALLLLLPLLAVPWAFKPYAANVLAVYMIYGILALSLTLIWGYAGIMSFGQTAFFGIGAYAYGAIGLNWINRTQQTHAALVGGLVAAALLAAVVGYFMFYGRISDVYASIITLALTLVLFAFAVSTGGDEWVIGVARFGGFNGMFGQGESSQNIANFQIPPVTVWLPGMAEPFQFKINRESAAGYFLVLGASVLVYVVVRWLLRVRLGRVAIGIRENEARVASLGYDTRFYKFALFTIAGAIAGLAGILFAAWGRFVNPDRFGLGFASSTVVYVLLGGRTSLLGGFVGAAIIGYLTSYLAEIVPFATIPGDATPWMRFLMEAGRRIVREAPLLVQGAVLVGIVLALEDGVTPPLSRLLTRYRRWAWWVLLPVVVLYFAHRVACLQADWCLF
ncbi:MAG: branched-chain amino acid ABC transporter permease [Candidatus Rokuibacteriota bacterium]|nr:MAG: branched-chain amino acid ABC transporter permease [Candidatus Rokubacteria bacterium]